MDFHCHLDLYSEARKVYEEAARRNAFTWLVTTSPKAFEATSRVLEPSPSVLITPGLHPEIAHDRANELGMLLDQIRNVRAVGEVGLDGSPRFKAHYMEQRRIFKAVVARCAELGGRTLSIHSRRAVKDLLFELEQHPGYGIAVLHWFSGTHSELKSAVEHDCWFSVGPAMFESANGRELAANMPRNRVLPESDGPFAQIAGKPVMPWDANQVATKLCAAWGISIDDAVKHLEDNGNQLLKSMG